MQFFLGVDAGGTKTRAIVVRPDGAVVGRGEAGLGNWQAAGRELAGANICAAVRAALAQANEKGTDQVRAGFFALAGVRTMEERAAMAQALAGLDLGARLTVASDLAAAHAGALAGQPGIVVIAGTGSAAWGRNAHGTEAQAGGWGWLVDDAGGGYWLALRGLSAACEAEDGRGPASLLGARAGEYFGAPGLRELLRELHAGKHPRAYVAGFARHVRALAEGGDEVAQTLVQQAAGELIRLAAAVRRRLGETETSRLRLAVTGGLNLGPVVAPLATAAGFEPISPWAEPVAGAALAAARGAGHEFPSNALARLATEAAGGG